MKLPSWKIILSFVAIFIAGAVCGTVVTLGVVKKIVTQHQRFDRWPEMMMKRLDSRLALDADQRAKIRLAVEAAAKDLHAEREQTRIEILKTLRGLEGKVGSELRPEQQAQFDSLRKEFRKRFNLPPPPELAIKPAKSN
jgi:hypothetical protein